MFIANLPIYKKLTRHRSVLFARRIAALLPENARVLDFGCGNMYTSQEIVKINPSVHITGIDVIRDQNLDNAHLDSKNLDFKLLETRALPFPDNSFDATVALTVMHHTDDPEYYLSELKRVTRPNGSIILFEEMYINSFDKFIISSHDWILNKLKEGVPVPLNFRSHRHYLEEFQKQGLEILHQDGIRAFLTGMHLYIYQLRKKQ